MPNWCHNILAVSGPREAVAAFAERYRVSTQKFAQDAPRPVDLPRDESSNPDSRATIEFLYDTAWEPDFQALATVSRRNLAVGLAVRYCENGNDFVGVAEFGDGKIVRRDERPYSDLLAELAEAGRLEWFDPDDHSQGAAVDDVSEHWDILQGVVFVQGKVTHEDLVRPTVEDGPK
jgi:hypothetical protein